MASLTKLSPYVELCFELYLQTVFLVYCLDVFYVVQSLRDRNTYYVWNCRTRINFVEKNNKNGKNRNNLGKSRIFDTKGNSFASQSLNTQNAWVLVTAFSTEYVHKFF